MHLLREYLSIRRLFAHFRLSKYQLTVNSLSPRGRQKKQVQMNQTMGIQSFQPCCFKSPKLVECCSLYYCDLCLYCCLVNQRITVFSVHSSRATKAIFRNSCTWKWMTERKAVRRLSSEKDSMLNGIPTFVPDGFRRSYENCIRKRKFTIAIKNNVIFVFVYIPRIYLKMCNS